MASPSSRKIYQIKVTLKGIRPPLWRRLLVADSIKLSQLHDVLQVVMGWTDSHLHQFIANGRLYGELTPMLDMDVEDENKVKLSQLLQREKDNLTYEYDFGDSWEHLISLEKLMPFERDTRLPVCIKGKGACPPEDIGGVWGYATFVEAWNDPNHPEHDTYADWFEGDFDPKAFDIEQVNTILQG